MISLRRIRHLNLRRNLRLIVNTNNMVTSTSMTGPSNHLPLSRHQRVTLPIRRIISLRRISTVNLRRTRKLLRLPSTLLTASNPRLNHRRHQQTQLISQRRLATNLFNPAMRQQTIRRHTTLNGRHARRHQRLLMKHHSKCNVGATVNTRPSSKRKFKTKEGNTNRRIRTS